MNETAKGEDADAITRSVEELNQAVAAFSQHLHQQAQACGTEDCCQAEGGSETSQDEDVIDAEFETAGA